MTLISKNNCSFSELLLQKIKTLLLLAVFTVSSLNVFSQTSSLISACGDFVAGPNATWPYVLVATTVADGAVSQGAQTFTMNVTSLPAGGANVRVFKTTANGSSFFGSPVALVLGSNSITVAAVGFDRAVKFQFSSGDVEFDALSLNGVASSCVGATIAIPGCTDPLATNYDSTATIDDGSCTYPPTCGAITGVNLTDVIHDRLVFNWDNMNSATCVVDQIRIQYREVGTSAYSTKTMGAPVGNNAPALNTSKRVLNLSASTQYEYDFKIWYLDGTVVTWHAGGTFTTAPLCDNVINVTATPVNTTKTTFCWDTVSTYSFVRLQYRENVPGSSFSNIGGFGVFSPLTCKDKNGLTPGTEYRVMWRTWCSATGGPYRSPVWDGPVIWTQPTSIRVEGGTAINNLDVYPNPSRDIFNVSFTSEDVQNLDVRVLNLVGEIIFLEHLINFEGEYTKSFNLSEYSKGVYFLEIETNDGVVNKKLILQ